MSQGTVVIGLLALAMTTACGGLGNPGDEATSNPFTTTSVPPWMGSSSGAPTTGAGEGASQATSTSGVSESASSSGTPTTGANESTGDASSTGSSSTGDSGGPPKLDLPPSLSTGNDEDKDKDDDKDKDEDSL